MTNFPDARLKTASEIWTSLRTIHEAKDYSSAITIQRGLFVLYAKEGADVIQHLSKLKQQWKRLNVLDNTSFHIPDRQFKTIIVSSLSPSWDVFTERYMGGHLDIVETDPKKMMSSQEFIGAIKEEYLHRKYWIDAPVEQTSCSQASKEPTSLVARVHDPPKSSAGSACRCRNCGLTNHTTENCWWLGQSRCTKCTWFGHTASECT